MSYYSEDVVQVEKDGVLTDAVVIRCWADESPEAIAEAARLNIPYTPLARGQLELLFSDQKRIEISEDLCTIVDRGFQAGDLVKSSLSNGKTQAGVIVDLSTKVQLKAVLSGEVIEGWIDSNEVVGPRLSRGDHVILDNWVGIIEEVFEMATVEAPNGLRKICDTGNNFSVGQLADGVLFGLEIPGGLRRVLEVNQIVVAVNWLAMNQHLDISSQNNSIRPKRYFSGMDIGTLSLGRASADHLHSIGDKVVFRDPTSHLPSPELLSAPNSSGQRVLVVTSSRSTAEVLWQDGTRETLETPSLAHNTDIDEDVDVFPGDVGVYTVDNRVAVVQSMNIKKRTLQLRFYGTDTIEEVSGLEFDPHGPPPDLYGVNRQDFVLITPQDTGVLIPTVPRLGESEILRGSFPNPEQLRGELSNIGLQLVSTLTSLPPLPKTGSDLSSIEWYGEVIDLNLDGTAQVRFPSGKSQSIPLSRIYHLEDGLDPDGTGMEGDEDAYMSDGEEEEYEDEDDENDMSDSSEGIQLSGMPGGWDQDENVEMEDDEDGWADEEEVEKKEEEVIVVIKPSSVIEEVALPPEVHNWSRFKVLEEAPPDHHYYKEQVQIPVKAYISRVNKELMILNSSLPPNILVRSYETRADLLRVLIIGPSGTPFVNAPFLFDIFLSPTQFPLEPPKVFFHSWAGNTRVSPNLYAEGKVCLSLLGTWEGEQSESWSSARSSILQLVISIQSLIMTSNPYFTEPGFEKNVATIEGQDASALYSERTYVLTRNFVKRGCEYPPTNFEEEIKAFYLTGLSTDSTSGVLQLVIEEAKILLEESREFHQDEGGDEEEKKRRSSRIVPLRVLTEGASLTLKRTLKGLIELL